jgi:hypothetical protein
MLNHEKLMELYRELRHQKVLSVYLDADQHDPAERNKWRIRLEHEVSRRRKELDGSDSERGGFDQAWERLRTRLEGFDAFMPERGWVGFATPDRVWYAENVPVPMPDGVYWEDGIHVAPYVRGLKQTRPVVVVVLDSRRARIFRYHAGGVAELQDCRADTFMGDLTDVNMSKRAMSHTGVRGETSTDAAQRALDISSGKMLRQVAGIATELVGSQGFLILGGVTEAVARAVPEFPRNLQTRIIEVSGLYVEIGDAELKGLVESAASALTRRYQMELLDGVVESAGPGGRACLGSDETLRALREMRVDTLLLSRSLIRSDPERADECVGAALAQGASVEELSDEGAERLDAVGGGMAARLRYRTRDVTEREGAETAGRGVDRS